MKRLTVVYLVVSMMFFVFTGCQEKLTEKGRVDGSTFTFTTEEFKELYNELAPNSKQIEDLEESKLDNHEAYVAYKIFDEFSIGTETTAMGGKVVEVSFEYEGGEVSDGGGGLSEVSLSTGQLNTFEKYATYIYQVCSPNVSKQEFNSFFDSAIGEASLLKPSSKTIGDIEVVFDPTYGMEISFRPVQ